jgi:hypothetical protein
VIIGYYPNGRIIYNYNKVHTCSFVADEAMTAAGRHFFTAALDTGKPAIGDVAVGLAMGREVIYMPPCLFVWIITNEIYREHENDFTIHG